MNTIRPMERDDLAAVAGLYERVMRSGSTIPAAGLRDWFERMLFGNTWSDPAIPSLVALDGEERVVGMLCSHVRRLRIDGRPARLAVSGQLVVAREARQRAAGARLMHAYLAGPQELTITDGATEVVRAMWERLGGDAAPLQCVEWWRPLRPWRSAVAVWERRRKRALPIALGRAADVVDRGTLSLTRRGHPALLAPEPLTPFLLSNALPELTRRFRLAPDYDAEFASWLLNELGEVVGRGELRARLVRADSGAALGYFIYYLMPAGISPVIAVVAPDEATTGSVLDALIGDAEAGGGAALHGRLEPRLLAPISARHALFRYAGGALVHASDPAIMALATSRHALLTRLEGEWWMTPHLDVIASGTA